MATVGDTVDDQGAHTTDAFPAVGVKGNGLLATRNEVFVHYVEHLQEGHVLDDILAW